jgi:hypothetical protein
MRAAAPCVDTHAEEESESNGDSAAPYESHIKTSAGKELEVLVSKDFKVLDAREHPARP